MSRKAKTNGSTALATVATMRHRRCTLPAVKLTRALKRARWNCTTRHARNATNASATSKRSSAAPIASTSPSRGLAAHSGAARRDRGAAATRERDRRRAEGREVRRPDRHDDWRRQRASRDRSVRSSCSPRSSKPTTSAGTGAASGRRARTTRCSPATKSSTIRSAR